MICSELGMIRSELGMICSELGMICSEFGMVRGKICIFGLCSRDSCFELCLNLVDLGFGVLKISFKLGVLSFEDEDFVL